MRAQIHLGRILGIRIGLHYSWIIIAILIVFSLSQQFGVVHRNWNPTVVWGTAIFTALIFFICILLHELGHSIVAQSRGIRVPSIVLFALGGVSQMERDSPDARTEFWMALAGPLVSFILGSHPSQPFCGREKNKTSLLKRYTRTYCGTSKIFSTVK